jgi:hypothetical protein
MPPKVFVSYSHDSDAHKARVAEFVARLRGEGIDVVYDEDLTKVGGPDEGWPRWCERQIVECDYVLACCTAMFHQRFEGEQQEGTGLGVAWEAVSIRQHLYRNPNRNEKVRAVVLEEGDRSYVPNALQPYSVFLVSPNEICAELVGWLKAAAATISLEADEAAEIAVGWLPPVEDFSRGLADRSQEFDRFRAMLSGQNSHRILLVQGPSGSGKTALISECVLYARHRRVPVSHIDFKGGLPLEGVFNELLLDFPKAMLPKASACEASARAVAAIADLQEARKPLFIAFDTYQEAPQGGRDWIERQLLPRIARCPALIIALAGQTIPEHSARSWAPLAYPAALPPILSPDDWYDYAGRKHGSSSITRSDIRTLTLATNGNPGQISALIDTLARNSPPP